MITSLIFTGILTIAFFVLAYVFGLSFVIWMAVDAAKQNKYWWIVLVVGLPLIGAIVYFFVEKNGDYMKLEAEDSQKGKQG